MSIILAIRDSFSEEKAWLKYPIYTLPVWGMAHLYIAGNLSMFWYLANMASVSIATIIPTFFMILVYHTIVVLY